MRNTVFYLLLSLFFVSYSQDYYLFVGTYTYNNSGAEGIYVYKLEGSTGALSLLSHTDSTVINPTYIAVAPDGKHLYVTTEARIPNAGSISVFAFDAKQGKLSLVNKQPSGGDNPSYVAVNKAQTWVVTSNFSAGSLAAFPINKDGSIKPYTQLIQHKGKPDAEGKEAPHVHATVFSADQKFVVVPDPGAQQIAVYAFDEKQKEKPFLANPKTIPSRSGSFVRHYDFHPNGKFAYAIHERSGTVAAYTYKMGCWIPCKS